MKTYNLFISHSWKYTDSYDRLLNILHNRGYFYFKNYSVPRIDPIIGAQGDIALYSA
ncbi:molecular chaperone Tir, partial [Salmonella enterica]|nr:molecular chaperone Tir [Salmonella enterica]